MDLSLMVDDRLVYTFSFGGQDIESIGGVRDKNCLFFIIHGYILLWAIFWISVYNGSIFF